MHTADDSSMLAHKCDENLVASVGFVCDFSKTSRRRWGWQRTSLIIFFRTPPPALKVTRNPHSDDFMLSKRSLNYELCVAKDGNDGE